MCSVSGPPSVASSNFSPPMQLSLVTMPVASRRLAASGAFDGEVVTDTVSGGVPDDVGDTGADAGADAGADDAAEGCRTVAGCAASESSGENSLTCCKNVKNCSACARSMG